MGTRGGGRGGGPSGWHPHGPDVCQGARGAIPGRRLTRRLPHRALDRETELPGQLQHAAIARVGEVPFLIDIQEGDARLEGRVHVAPASDEDIHPLVTDDIDESPGVAIIDHDGVLAHQGADTGLVILRGLAGAGSDHHHAEVLQGRDDGPGLDATRVEQDLAALEPRPPGCELAVDGQLLPRDDGLGAGGQVRVADDPGEVPQGLGDIGHPIETALEPRRAVALLEQAGDIDHGLGADHHIDRRAVQGLHLPETGVARQVAQDPQAQLIEERQDVPELAGDVVFTDQGHVVDLETLPLAARGQGVRLPGPADIFHHRLPGDAIAQVLGTVEARRVHRHHRRPPAAGGLLAHRLDVVADQGRDTGVVNKDRRRPIGVDGLLDGVEQALLAPAHDDVLLGQVRGHADLVEGGTRGAGAPVVPGTARAGDGAVDDVGHVGDGQERDLGPVEGTAACRRPRLGLGAARLGLAVVGAGRLVEQGGDLLLFHRDPPSGVH